MTQKEQKNKILDFFKTELLGVVSTIGSENGNPQSALVAFTQTPDLHLIFGTADITRKFKNLLKNQAVSFVIGWEQTTVQYEGVAHILEGAEAKTGRDMIVAKNPLSKKFAFHDNQKFIKVTPTWIRFSDLRDPEGNFEVLF